MVSFIYCTREHNPEHIAHLNKVGGHPDVEVIEYINEGEGLTKFYKKGLEESKHDIVVFCHDDILVETKQVAKKLTKLFEKNPEYGILGVAGTKHMSETGRWWDNPKKMYGRVKHSNNGKSWLSAYSVDLNNDIEEVVIVDGLFFSVHKKRIKEDFNLDVKGFHFYDVDFCFRNYLKGVKVGVHTNVRINHMSIGETNHEWEENRKEFAEKYKEELPISLKRIFRPNERIKVLIGCISFANLTGSEMYVFELAKELMKQGCDVSICSQLGEPLTRKAHALGIKLFSIQEPPGYKVGDGEWSIQSPNGPMISEPGKLYQVAPVDFDIIHLNHKPITEHFLRLYPNVEKVCTIHSEVLDLEVPVIDEQIKKYITIRPEIKDFVINDHEVSEDKVEVIYNPIDYTKFKEVKTQREGGKKRTIFVGTIDYLRREALLDLISVTREENKELWIVGKENGVTIDELRNVDGGDTTHAKYFEATPNVHRLVQDCDETAGILLGRTTIEGWLCGKPGWIYDVDKQGRVLGKELHEVPSDVEKFRADKVTEKIINVYKEILV